MKMCCSFTILVAITSIGSVGAVATDAIGLRGFATIPTVCFFLIVISLVSLIIFLFANTVFYLNRVEISEEKLKTADDLMEALRQARQEMIQLKKTKLDEELKEIKKAEEIQSPTN
ncbi:hypothetical protein M3Y94_00769300 [Aphelenchoides besseyi]|nr:hypothetical protein M3Y94_00769300 [Aphelenchoides besseyi]